MTGPDDLLERLDDQGLYSKAERIQMIKDAAAEIRRLRGHAQVQTSPVSGPDTDQALVLLVDRFAKRLLAKLRLAHANGRRGWEKDDWEADCQRGLLRHLEKGDPRDIAAYCAFMDHHGWVTVAPSRPDHAQSPGLPIGYLIPKSGVDNGYYFLTAKEAEHIEERFKHLYTPVFTGPDTSTVRAYNPTFVEEIKRADEAPPAAWIDAKAEIDDGWPDSAVSSPTQNTVYSGGGDGTFDENDESMLPDRGGT